LRVVNLPPGPEVAARARAALAYADIDVKDSAERVGISSATMQRIVSPTSPRGVRTVEELWMIADACGVPRSFMEAGFEQANGDDRLASLEAQITELRAGLASLAADSLRRTRELEGRLGMDRRQAPGGGDR
jgi:transcriptional regulator with XRE-family HTH domain